MEKEDLKLERVTIYILELEDNKYYVGRSKKKTDSGIQLRIKQHFNQESSAAAWCKKYQPVKIVDIKKNETVFDENKWTKIYMQKYGIENVRGGDYVRVKLPKGQLSTLEREIDGANDKCHRCGESGHFIRFCPNKKKESVSGGGEKKESSISSCDVRREELVYVWECEKCLKQYDTEKECEECEKKHENDRVLCNLLKRFQTIHYRDIEGLCKKYNYHGGFVSRELRKIRTKNENRLMN